MRKGVQSSAVLILVLGVYVVCRYALIGRSGPDQFRDIERDLLAITNKSPPAKKITLSEALSRPLSESSTILEQFQLRMSDQELYEENDPVVDNLLKTLSQAKFKSITELMSGTQFKLIVEMEEGMKGLFKPKRIPNDREREPNTFVWAEYEKHFAEIAAFHLDRVLGLRRATPVVGRVVSVQKEVLELAEYDLLKTFYVSRDDNLCFEGSCKYFCDSNHPICGDPDALEISLTAWMPIKDFATTKTWTHPWRRSYSPRSRASWINLPDYCDRVVKKIKPYNKGRRIFDVMDLAVYDFLMGNWDRHHYLTFNVFGNDSALVHTDHGRAFGRYREDDFLAIAPLTHCCMIRHSLTEKLLSFHRGPVHLSDALRESMKEDPLAPVLSEGHFEALDRRVGIVLQIISECQKNSTKVIYSEEDVRRYDSGNKAIEYTNAKKVEFPIPPDQLSMFY